MAPSFSLVTIRGVGHNEMFTSPMRVNRLRTCHQPPEGARQWRSDTDTENDSPTGASHFHIHGLWHTYNPFES